MIAAIARAVATAVVVVALSVLCLIGLAAWLVVSTRADRQRARQARERARQARDAKAEPGLGDDALAMVKEWKPAPPVRRELRNIPRSDGAQPFHGDGLDDAIRQIITEGGNGA